MFISQAESIGFPEPDTERAPAELARRRRWPAMISRNTLACAAAIGLIVVSAGVRPAAQTHATTPSVSTPSVSNAGSVVGSAWNADNSGIPGAQAATAQVSYGQDFACVRHCRSARPVPFRGRGSPDPISSSSLTSPQSCSPSVRSSRSTRAKPWRRSCDPAQSSPGSLDSSATRPQRPSPPRRLRA